jgi:hypothetical protein
MSTFVRLVIITATGTVPRHLLLEEQMKALGIYVMLRHLPHSEKVPSPNVIGSALVKHVGISTSSLPPPPLLLSNIRRFSILIIKLMYLQHT